eukprot:TRINITY_DN4442_c0_g1_i1.p2 TRINITY_DN4442_c0_g1~~TRINITY_DN4442_c0_g1_i1.p2  ORF type:complete len:395 (-),score=12.60 TRINITY_DN4442_c0_g1_i1:1136-2248(-)
MDNELAISPINPYGSLKIKPEPKGCIYANTSFSLILNVCTKERLEEVKLSVYIFGTEKYSKNQKGYKYVFCKEKVESRLLSLAGRSHTTYLFPFTFVSKAYPSSFHYYDPAKEIKAKIYYKAKARITDKKSAVLLESSTTLPYCSYDLLGLETNFVQKMCGGKLRLSISLAKEIYRTDEVIVGKCKLSKCEASTDLTQAKVYCKLEQILFINDASLLFLGSGTKINKELTVVQYKAKGRPEFLGTESIEFPIVFDLKAVSLANSLGAVTKGKYVENKYQIIVAAQLDNEQNMLAAEALYIPLLITSAIDRQIRSTKVQMNYESNSKYKEVDTGTIGNTQRTRAKLNQGIRVTSQQFQIQLPVSMDNLLQA